MIITTSDGVRLYCESEGEGTPIVFVHEFSGTCRSFDLQRAALRKGHRCISFNARGYPPSDVPPDVSLYSQEIAARDIVAVMGGLGLPNAHLVGVSMGAASSLQVALKHPNRVLSATLASIGTGSDAKPEENHAGMEAMAKLIESQGTAGLAATLGNSPARRRLKDRNPAEFTRFIDELKTLSVHGMANTMRGVQKKRPSIYADAEQLARLEVPVLILFGGDDAGCRGPSLFLQQTVPNARLHEFPQTGHLVNLERADMFNDLVSRFLVEVGSKKCAPAG